MSSLPVAGVLATTGVFFLICFLAVRYYYSVGLPYYDSVGSYWNMFAIMNAIQQQGLVEGVRQASAYSLSWLQSFFAVLTAPILPRTPQALLSLNILALLASQLAILSCARSIGYSRAKSYVVALLPLVPAALMSWDGGYVDMRRDASMFSLLTASFFLAWTHAWRPRVRTAVALGLAVGLTQWSRGNALPYIVAVLAPVAVVWLYHHLRQHGRRGLAKPWLLPIAVFLAVATPFYWLTLAATLNKYLYGSWALGAGRLASLRDFWFAPAYLLLAVGRHDLTIEMASAAALAVAAAGIAGLVVLGLLRLDTRSWREHKPLQLLTSGILVVLSVMSFNILVLGVQRSATFIPFFPLLVGLVPVGVWAAAGIRANEDHPRAKGQTALAVVVLTVALLGLNAYRVFAMMPQGTAAERARAEQVAADFSILVADSPVAYLWLDHINVHDLNFFITQQGGQPLQTSSLIGPGADTEMPPDPTRTIEQQRAAFAQGLRQRPFIVVTEDLSAYDDPSAFFFIFKYGKPMIEDLLGDRNMRKVYTFESGGRRFAILRNQAVP